MNILIQCSCDGILSKMEIKLKSCSTCWPQKEKLEKMVELYYNGALP